MYYNVLLTIFCLFKPRSQLAVRLFSPYVFFDARWDAFFLNTCVGRGMSREDARHTYVVITWHARHVMR